MPSATLGGVAVQRTPETLARELAQLGVKLGGVLMVHASLRRLGPVVGRADGLLDALRSALGPGGTILMVIAADDDEPFDRDRTPADPDNGVLAEVFRRRAGVEVNDHPACRFAAWGPAASELLEPQPLHDYYGVGSPLERLCTLDGAVLRLGADIDTVTLTHHAEYLARLPEKRRAERPYVRADRGEILIRSLDDTDGIAEWPGGDYFSRILLDFIEMGAAQTGIVGDCRAELLGARRFLGLRCSVDGA